MEDMDRLKEPLPSQIKKETLLLSMLNPSLEEVEKEEYLRFIHQYLNMFITSYEEIRGCRCESIHTEEKEGSKLVFQKLRRIQRELLLVLREELNKLLKVG